MGLLPPPIPILLLCLAISTSVSGYLNIFISHHEVMKLMAHYGSFQKHWPKLPIAVWPKTCSNEKSFASHWRDVRLSWLPNSRGLPTERSTMEEYQGGVPGGALGGVPGFQAGECVAVCQLGASPR
ncbi:uncharacterized protein [Drosophila suzukii]|uniref:Uncharacterized protein n=1 Tax=Drosophila suzukii TaxID=28584 RepID=A0ABM4TLU4_DROSZ